jgi:hypothetical protein
VRFGRVEQVGLAGRSAILLDLLVEGRVDGNVGGLERRGGGRSRCLFRLARRRQGDLVRPDPDHVLRGGEGESFGLEALLDRADRFALHPGQIDRSLIDPGYEAQGHGGIAQFGHQNLRTWIGEHSFDAGQRGPRHVPGQGQVVGGPDSRVEVEPSKGFRVRFIIGLLKMSALGSRT